MWEVMGAMDSQVTLQSLLPDGQGLLPTAPGSTQLSDPQGALPSLLPRPDWVRGLPEAVSQVAE